MLILTRRKLHMLAALLLLACITILVLAGLLLSQQGAAHLDVWHGLVVLSPQAISPHAEIGRHTMQPLLNQRIFTLAAVAADINIKQSLLDIVTAFALFVGGAVALSLLYAGYLMVFAGDDSSQELKARRIIGAAILGAVIAVGAVTLANTITNNIK